MFSAWLQRQWFERSSLPLVLFIFVPLVGLYRALFLLKRFFSTPQALSVPLVVVGNFVLGGTGKTPLTLSLAKSLKSKGWVPGIVSRGYGRKSDVIMPVTTETHAELCGDEPLLLARLGCPVWVGRSRFEAAKAMLEAHPEVNVVICDDGLQHWSFLPDFKIAVFDQRGIGNGWCLPCGPLREPARNISSVNAIVVNGGDNGSLGRFPSDAVTYSMRLLPDQFYALDAPNIRSTREHLVHKKLFAIAGIGAPEKFFQTLREMGLIFEAHAFPDHHAYSKEDLAFAASGVLLMTEKDAVKCKNIVHSEAWVLPVHAQVSDELLDHLVEKIRGRTSA